MPENNPLIIEWLAAHRACAMCNTGGHPLDRPDAGEALMVLYMQAVDAGHPAAQRMPHVVRCATHAAARHVEAVISCARQGLATIGTITL